MTRGECDERSGGGRREGSAFGEQKIQIWPIYRGRGHGQSPGHIQPPSRSICASSTLHYNNESLLASRRRVFQILTPSLYCPMSESLLCYHHHHLLYQVRAPFLLPQPTPLIPIQHPRSMDHVRASASPSPTVTHCTSSMSTGVPCQCSCILVITL